MTELLTTLAILFVAAGTLLLVANHFSLSPVPFYVLAGLIVGVGGFVDQPELIDLAQWGIAFLVFVFGFRVDFAAVQSVIRDGEVAAFTQLLVVAPLAFGIGLVFGFDAQNALYFSAAATLSSTLVGAGLLEQEIRDNLVHGRLASSVHFFDDLVAIFILLVLSAEAFTTTEITSQLGFGVLFLIAAALVYRHVFPLLLRFAAGSDELVLMGSVSILIAFLAGAELAGVSIVVGAFAAGLAIRSDGAESLEVLNGVESLRDFFVAIFFVTVGGLVSVPSLEVLVVASTLVVLVLLVNPLVLLVAFVSEGYDARTAYFASTSLNQVSELSLVIAIQAWLLETVSITVVTFEAIILAAVVTMILTSLTRRHEETIYRALVEDTVAGRQTRKLDERSAVADDLADHVVVVGYGRQGRWLVDTLERLERDYVVIENDPVVWDELRAECRHYVLGDATSRYTWERARLDTAELVLSTVAHRPVSEAILDLETDADVVVRADSSAVAREWLERGAAYVSVPNVLASDQLVFNLGGVLEGDLDPERLRREHLETLEELERYGFGSRISRDELY